MGHWDELKEKIPLLFCVFKVKFRISKQIFSKIATNNANRHWKSLKITVIFGFNINSSLIILSPARLIYAITL